MALYGPVWPMYDGIPPHHTQPQLPVTAVCCYCSLTGWGRPLSPVAGKRTKPEQKSTLYECRSCFRIAHIACTTRQVSDRGPERALDTRMVTLGDPVRNGTNTVSIFEAMNSDFIRSRPKIYAWLVMLFLATLPTNASVLKSARQSPIVC